MYSKRVPWVRIPLSPLILVHKVHTIPQPLIDAQFQGFFILTGSSAGTYWEYHISFYLKNDLYIFYNDDSDNDQFDITTSNKQPKDLHNIKDISFVEIRFDEIGNASRNVISNSKEMDTAINISLTKQLSPSRMVLYGLTMNGYGGNRQTKLGVLNFDSK